MVFYQKNNFKNIRKNFLFLMYWMLPLSSRIAPACVTLPMKYLKQNLSQLPYSFYSHVDYTAK